MNDFDYDVRQKKIVARGAAHRKNGSKSKRCSLPSDNLTEAQKRKLNGPCATVKMDQPMDWATFKKLPDGLRKEYIERLMEDYHTSQKMLAGMFGVSQSSVYLEMKRLGVKALPLHRHDYGTEYKVKTAKWEAFCNGVVGGGNNASPGQNEQVEAEDDAIEMVLEKREPEAEDLLENCDALEALNRSFEAEEEENSAEDDTEHAALLEEVCVSYEPKRTNLSRMELLYEDNADSVSAQLAELFRLFANEKVEVRIRVKVVGADA